MSFNGPVWVDFNYGGFLQFGTFVFPDKTLALGVSTVPAGGTINIKPGNSTVVIIAREDDDLAGLARAIQGARDPGNNSRYDW